MFKKILVSIVNYFWNLFYPEWSDTEVKTFFDKFNNAFELSNYLIANGFKWQSDGLNLLPLPALDTFERPGQVLARGGANCSGYMALFSSFIKYKRCADRLEECLLHNGPIGAWHYVGLIQDCGITYIQSNMSVTILDKPLLELYKDKYKNMEMIAVWEK